MGTPNRAELTIPDQIMRLVMSSIEGADRGLEAIRPVACNAVFGPYEGLIELQGKAAEMSGKSWMVKELTELNCVLVHIDLYFFRV